MLLVIRSFNVRKIRLKSSQHLVVGQKLTDASGGRLLA
jgi:hypothetical protein